MKVKKAIIISVILLIISFIFISDNVQNDKSSMYYKEYLRQLDEEYHGDIDIILEKVEEELQKSKNVGLNLVARQHYIYLLRDNEKFMNTFYEAEKYLRDHNMNEELLHIYSMIAGRYTGDEKYTNAYIYIYKGEKIAKKLYEESKSEEDLSTLIAIRYLKAVIALEIGMENEADKVFEEAEALRRKYNGRERTDIYHNILLYYEYKGNDEKIEEYAKKQINLTKGNESLYNDYIKSFIDANVILANSYLKTGRIYECVEIARGLNKQDFISTNRLYKLYKLYGNIYKYYGDTENYTKYLQMAYDQFEGLTLNRKKIEIVNELLQQYEADNNQEKIIELNKTYREISNEFEGLADIQYIMKDIIDTDLQDANESIDILQLQKANLRYVIIIMMLLISIAIALIVVEKRRKKLLKENLEILEKQMNLQHDYYESIKKHQEYTRAIRHDMVNHFSVVTKLLEDEEYEHTKSYVEKLSSQIIKIERNRITANKIIDAILSSKSDVCKLKNIQLYLDIKIPEVVDIDELDLCIIYGNLLDNAIEACDKMSRDNNKYIKVKSIIKGDYLFLNIKNSKNNNVIRKENKFITSKIDKINHGIGIRNIKRSVKKYDGEVNISYTDLEFNVKVILKR